MSTIRDGYEYDEEMVDRANAIVTRTAEMLLGVLHHHVKAIRADLPMTDAEVNSMINHLGNNGSYDVSYWHCLEVDGKNEEGEEEMDFVKQSRKDAKEAAAKVLNGKPASFVYQPGNGSRFDVTLTPLEDGSVLLSLANFNSCMVINGYAAPSYCEEKLALTHGDAQAISKMITKYLNKR
jgi:hypothetical protein